MSVTRSRFAAVEKSAVVSACELYRYSLSRTWSWDETAGRVLWIMLNPSTADANLDDPTIRRCMAFTNGWGKSGLTVVNLFGWRSPSPKQLVSGADVIGPQNDVHIRAMLQEHSRRQDYIVAAWGSHGSHKDLRARRDAVLKFLPVAETFCLGTTVRGDPRHPLYVHGDTGLHQYEFPASAWGEAMPDRRNERRTCDECGTDIEGSGGNICVDCSGRFCDECRWDHPDCDPDALVGPAPRNPTDPPLFRPAEAGGFFAGGML